MESKELKFNGQTINFEIENKNVMVNATEMAKVFNKRVYDFTELQNTQELVKKLVEKENVNPEIEQNDNSRYGNSRNGKSEKNEFEYEFTSKGKFVKVVQGGNNQGTWMDRRIAIAFAMWLDAEFYLWVCETIDEILFGSIEEEEELLKSIADYQDQITQKEDELKNLPILKEIEDLRKAVKNKNRQVNTLKNKRISGYRTIFTTKEMTGQ